MNRARAHTQQRGPPRGARAKARTPAHAARGCVSQEKSSVRKRFREAPRETSMNTQFCIPGGSDPARANHRVVPCTYFTLGNYFFQETENRTCLFKVYQTKHDGNICHRGLDSARPRSAGAGDFGRRPPEASPEEVGTVPGHRGGREGDEGGRERGRRSHLPLEPAWPPPPDAPPTSAYSACAGGGSEVKPPPIGTERRQSGGAGRT